MIYNTCPWCNASHPLLQKSFHTVVKGKIREVKVFDCGTQVSQFYEKGKNRTEWIKTCRQISKPKSLDDWLAE